MDFEVTVFAPVYGNLNVVFSADSINNAWYKNLKKKDSNYSYILWPRGGYSTSNQISKFNDDPKKIEFSSTTNPATINKMFALIDTAIATKGENMT
jgi:hypothetical protein